jgi:DNA polymerase III epsilon subunit-like protein
MLSDLVFLDCEASSLGRDSYPIEIGWCVASSGAIESHLIMPHPDWLDWDPSAQEVHGISRRTLFEQGEPGPRVARRLIEALNSQKAFSEDEFDQRWLAALCMKADVRPVPRLQSFEALLDRVLNRIADADVRALQIAHARTRAATYAPRRHRAGPDAFHLRAVYLEAIAGNSRS